MLLLLLLLIVLDHTLCIIAVSLHPHQFIQHAMRESRLFRYKSNTNPPLRRVDIGLLTSWWFGVVLASSFDA